MKTTIAILTWNRLEYVRESVRAHLEHNSPHVLYLCDNGSEDGTAEYIRDLAIPPHIECHKLFFKKNYGMYRVLNLVWGRANTELIGNISTDLKTKTDWVGAFERAAVDFPDFVGFATTDRDWTQQYPQRTAGSTSLSEGPDWAFCAFAYVYKKSIFDMLGPIPYNSPVRSLMVLFKGIQDMGPTGALHSVNFGHSMESLVNTMPMTHDPKFRRLGIINRLLLQTSPRYYMKMVGGPLEWIEDGKECSIPLEHPRFWNRELFEKDGNVHAHALDDRWTGPEFQRSWINEFPDLAEEYKKLTGA